MSGTKTKGAFGKCKVKGEYPFVFRHCSCFRCDRQSKFNKKNFPIPVVIDVLNEEGKKVKKKVGHICKVCVRKAYKLKK